MYSHRNNAVVCSDDDDGVVVITNDNGVVRQLSCGEADTPKLETSVRRDGSATTII